VTKTFPLADMNEALDALDKGAVARGVIVY
jgi:Zn-dependent alcohol dehydrogenase